MKTFWLASIVSFQLLGSSDLWSQAGLPRQPQSPVVVRSDTNATAVVPPGLGTLRQDAIALKLQLPDILVRLIPLDEDVIRTLSPDSYRALHELSEGRRPAVRQLAMQHGLQHVSLWYVMFYGLAADARFSPLEITITSSGRDYRPVEVIPLSPGFGNQRVQPRETQSALYLFEEALDVNQPLVVSFSGVRNETWQTLLREIEQERALIRSRAQAKNNTTP